MTFTMTSYEFVTPDVTAGLLRGTLPDGRAWERVLVTPFRENQLATSLELGAHAYAIDAEMHRDCGVIFTPELHDAPDDPATCRCAAIAAKAARYTRSLTRTVLVRVWLEGEPDGSRWEGSPTNDEARV